ncbi:tRNA pseudouridine(55) synthase TruB [Marinilabiliaceae bacterium ANBcel2]|nr:tRNA pseudouridine(55) synthase TruB [Marinilabiliaceae bacterium ANBcel2]
MTDIDGLKLFSKDEKIGEKEYREGCIILIDKPFKWTSFNVVSKIRVLLKHYMGIKKIKTGHAGTLDPLATGLLILCTGKATKSIDTLVNSEKEYIADITLGATTPSYDLETEVDNISDYSNITNGKIIWSLNSFKGKQTQVPPVYSAVKVKGKKAYEHARKGESLNLKEREIEIYNAELLEYNAPVAKVKINCSKGTYIRSLANDIGKKLNTGAYLSALKRTKSGEYTIEMASSIEEFEDALKKSIDK